MTVHDVWPKPLLCKGYHGISKTLSLGEQREVFFSGRARGLFFRRQRDLNPLHVWHIEIIAPVVRQKNYPVRRISRQFNGQPVKLAGEVVVSKKYFHINRISGAILQDGA